MKVFLVAAFGLMCNIEIRSASLATSEFFGCMYTYGWRIYYTMIVCIKLISTKNWFSKMNGSLGCCGKWGKWTNLSWICPTMNSSKQSSIQESELQFERVYLSVDPTWWIFFSCTNAMENSTASNIWMMSTSPECWLQGGRQQRLQFCLNDLGTKFANSFFLPFETPPVLDAFASLAENFTGSRLWFLISAASGAWSIAAEFQFLFTFVSGRYKEVYIKDLSHERGNFFFCHWWKGELQMVVVKWIFLVSFFMNKIGFEGFIKKLS